MRRIALLGLWLSLSPAYAQTAEGSPRAKRSWERAYLLSRAGDAFAHERLADAEKLFRSVLRLEPDDETALRHLAAIAQKRNDRASALAWLTRAARAHPKSFAVRHELGGVLLSLGRPAQAVEHFKAALELKSNSLDAWINYGDCLSLTGKRAEAIDAYQRGLKVSPDSAWAHRQLGYALLDLHRFAEALPHLERAQKEYPKEADLQLALGHAHNEQGNDASALNAYRQFTALNPKSGLGHLFEGNVLDRMGHFVEAERAYSRAIRLAPRDPLPKVHLGNLYRRRGLNREARAHYQMALKAKPDFVWALAQLGFLALEEGADAEAQKLLRRAFRIAPENADVAVALGDLFQAQGKLDQAESYYRRVLSKDAGHLGARVKLGDVMRRRGQFAEALSHYRTAVRGHPKSAWAQISLGDCQRQLGQLADAKASYQEALRIDPESLWGKRQMAFVLFDLGEDEESLRLLTSLLPALDSEVDVHLTLGHLRRRAQANAQALAHYQRAAEVAPMHARARLFVADLKRALGDFPAAIEGYRAALSLDPKLLDAWVLLGDAAKTQAEVLAQKEPDSPRHAEHLMLAREAYEKAIELDPSAPWPKRQLGFLAFDAGDHALAESLLTAAKGPYAGDVEIPLTLGHVLRLRGAHPQALGFYREAVALAPKDERPRVFAGQSLRELGRYGEALEELKQAVSLAPESGWAWLQLAFTQLAGRDPSSALASVSRAATLAPSDRDAWLFYGKLKHRQRDFEEAVSAYRRAVLLSPNHAPARRALASALLDRRGPNDLEEAREEIEQVLPLLEQDAFTHLIAGHLYAHRFATLKEPRPLGANVPAHLAWVEAKQRAVGHFVRALELSPDDRATRVSVAQGLYNLEENGRAEEALAPLLDGNRTHCPKNEWELQWESPDSVRAAGSQSPEELSALEETQLTAVAFLISGDLYARKGHETTSRLAYACSIALWKDNPEAHLRLGLAYETAGLMRLAEEHYLMALALRKEQPQAKAGLERLRKEGGHPVGPIRASGELAIRSDPLPPEVQARHAKALQLAGEESARRLLTVPRTVSVAAAISHQPERFPRFDLQYAYLWGQNASLTESAIFEDSQGHALTAQAIGSTSISNDRRAELRYQGQYRLLWNSLPSRSEVRHLAAASARLTQIHWGSIEGLLGIDRGDFRLAPEVSADTASTSGFWGFRFAPVLRHLRLEGSVAYRGQVDWLSPSSRTLWTHALETEGLARRDRLLWGGEARLATTSDSLELPDELSPSAWSTSLAGKVGFVFTGYTWAIGRVGIANVLGEPQFDQLRIGFEGTHRFLSSTAGGTGSGLTLSLSFESRFSYQLAAASHLVSASLSFAR